MHERIPENRNIFIFPTPELSELNERIQWRVKLKERTKGNEQKKRKLFYNITSYLSHNIVIIGLYPVLSV
jgi:uncharacterized membrane protein YecN with MAPEG domain